MERISLYVYYFNDDSVPLVNTWLSLALHNGVSNLRFDCDRADQNYPLPETIFSINSALLCGSSESFNLQKLDLAGIFLSDSMVRDIFRNCPNLSDVSLSNIFGLKVLNICKPGKLARLIIRIPNWGIELKSIIVDALSLKSFSLVVFDRDSPGVMTDLTFCYNLRELKLNHSSITDDVFNLNNSRLPLEVLEIVACDELQSIKISLHRLKHLTIDSCELLKTIEIDAPMLSKFVYTPMLRELAELVLADEIPGSMYLTYRNYSSDVLIDSSWFFEIREYLAVPFKGIVFSFYINDDFDPEELSFNHDDLSEAVIPPLVKVDCLDLSDLYVENSSHWDTLLDGLLWSCHPKMVCVKDYQFEENWIKIEALCEMLNKVNADYAAICRAASVGAIA